MHCIKVFIINNVKCNKRKTTMYKKMDSESFVRVSSNGTRVSSGGDRVFEEPSKKRMIFYVKAIGRSK